MESAEYVSRHPAELGDYAEVFAVGEAVLGVILVCEYGYVVPVGFGCGCHVEDKAFGATNTEIWMNYQDSHLDKIYLEYRPKNDDLDFCQ